MLAHTPRWADAQVAGEGEYFVWASLVGVDHDAIGTRRYILLRPLQGVLEAGTSDQAFKPGDDHEVIGERHFSARSYLLGED